MAGVVGGVVLTVMGAGAFLGWQAHGAIGDTSIPPPNNAHSVVAPGCKTGDLFVWKDDKGKSVMVMRKGTRLGAEVSSVGQAVDALHQGDAYQGAVVVLPAPDAKACNG